jgi:predicted nucleic acid-binding protein
MKIIADTNTFIAVALNEPEKELIISLTEGHDLVAPEVLPFEIGNALTAMVKRNSLLADEAILAWDAIQNIPVELRRINISAALKIAIECNIYAYDAYFLECALNQRSPLLTLDRQMREIARKIGIQIME